MSKLSKSDVEYIMWALGFATGSVIKEGRESLAEKLRQVAVKVSSLEISDPLSPSINSEEL